jgi:DNA-binding winged helix-turn-helix (wHTH) protein/Tol biopolymer transport system component
VENGSATVRFSVFELDLKSGELRRDGSRIRLQEQPFQILIALLEKPGQVVSRDELRSKLWPADTFVDFDHSLNAAIRRLRDALYDSAETPRFVETVARRGYRFIAPVQRFEASTAAAESNLPVANAVQPSPAAPRHTAPLQATGHLARHKWISLVAAVGLLITGISIGFYLASRSSTTQVSERPLTANPSEAPVLSAALSPSGRYLAFADTTGVYVRQVDNGETHSVPLPAGLAAIPLNWFPDDNHLVLAAESSATGRSSLWRISVLGGEPQLLVDDGSSAVVSPDGTQIAFVRGREPSETIWVMRADGQSPAEVLACKGCLISALAWSPSAGRVGYLKREYQIGSLWSFDTQLDILDLASKRSEVIERHVGLGLAWTSDGRILYSTEEPPPNQNDSTLWAIEIGASMRPSGAPRRLTTGNGVIAAITASANAKRLAVTRHQLQPDVYVADLTDHGRRLSPPRLLTLDERQDFPTAWTADSKSVLFFSDRDGVFHIFKQAIDQAEPMLLVGGTEPVGIPRLSPDGSLVIYLNSPMHVSPRSGDEIGMQRLMRVPVNGGPPQLILEGRGINNLQCARSPANLCLYSEIGQGEERFYTFDSIKGKGDVLTAATIHDRDYSSFNWSLSPDGKTLAISKKVGIQDPPGVRLFSLATAQEHFIELGGWAGIMTLDWSADSKSLWTTAFRAPANASLWTTSFSPGGPWSFLKVDLSGTVTPMLHEDKMNLGWAIPSPDGSKLALWKATGRSNVWLVESP